MHLFPLNKNRCTNIQRKIKKKFFLFLFNLFIIVSCQYIKKNGKKCDLIFIIINYNPQVIISNNSKFVN